MADDTANGRPPVGDRDWFGELIGVPTESEGVTGDVSNAKPSVDEWLTELLDEEIPRLKDSASLHESAAEDYPAEDRLARPDTGVSAGAVKLTGEQYMTLLLGQRQSDRLPAHCDRTHIPAAKTANEPAATAMAQNPGRMLLLILTVAVVYLKWRQDSCRLPGQPTRAPGCRRGWVARRRPGIDATLSNGSTEHHGR
jgi:hypothetical protein